MDRSRCRPPRAALLLATAVLTAAAGGCGTPAPPPPASDTEPRSPVEAATAVDRAVATTGDEITYRVTVDHDPAYEIELPEPGAEIAGFRIFDLGREVGEAAGGRRREERWYRLRADLVGSYVLPPVAVRYRPLAGDEEWQAVETSALFVEVESVLPAAGAAEDIRGLRPLRPPRRRAPWPWVAAGLAVLALAVTAFWLWRRRPRPAVPLVPPHELAFRRLDELRGTDFQVPAAVRRFHFAISEVVRAYVEGRWGFNATDLTSEEIIAGLGRLEGLPAAAATGLREFLVATDRVKFAEHRPGEREILETWERALGFVEATRPQPEPEAEAAAAREAA